MIDLIREEFRGTHAEAELETTLSDAVSQYQRAFEFLHAKRGQSVVNRIVQTAVWQALDAGRRPSSQPPSAPDADFATCRTLEREVGAWVLPSAVDMFGDLLVTCSDPFGGAVLTTNFDPLIEISLRKHGGQCYRTVLHSDGKLGQTVAEGTHIVHLHGYWWGSDTLHTPQQLLQPRPQLRQSLARVIEESILTVVGYSGWDDVITRTLVELLTDSRSNPEILWAFHGDDAKVIEASNRRLLDVLSPGIGRGRISLYHNVDCRLVFSEIREQLKLSYPIDSTEQSHGRRVTATRKAGVGGADKRPRVRIAINFPTVKQTSAEPDRPLLITPWVGRSQELSILATSATPVAFVTGLGGQGKSALAGRFLQQHAMSEGGRFELWDWRDCREESDRLGTQILRVIERLSDGVVDASRIEATDIKAVVGILFQVICDRRVLFVFDNVDQYIDLETLKPVKGLDVLVSEAQSRSHQCMFLLTCRPDVHVEESRAARITLSGLTEDETTELIIARGVSKHDCHLAAELHRTTQGHVLWVNLVAIQAVRHKDGLRGALDMIGRGGATLPETTRTIWGMLNEQQQKVLRTMAELDRPEPENRLLELLPGLNANRVNRALGTLRRFHLVEVRTQPEGDPLLGLHPIIREFVRTNFPKKDREQYVGAILGFLDRMIARFKDLLGQEPSYQILEHWTRKAELQITIGRFEDATATVAEIASSLLARGYSEEMVRLGRRLLREVDWAEACSSYKDFDEVFQGCVKVMIEMGHEAIEDLLEKYEAAIPGKSAQFILLCDLRCYAKWFVREFELAIRWGERGEKLKESTAVDTVFSTKHNLALSRRDGGRVTEALETLLDGEALSAVVTPGERIEQRGAHFFGNVGRCLFLTERREDALVCYAKSAQLLEPSTNSRNQLNRGYIREWIAELLVEKGDLDLAAASYRAAVCIWEGISPPRAEEAKRALEGMAAEHPRLSVYIDELDWRVEEAFGQWLALQ